MLDADTRVKSFHSYFAIAQMSGKGGGKEKKWKELP